MKEPSKNASEWANEFNEFLNTPPVTPAAFLSDEIKTRVARDLNPTVWRILRRLALVHVFSGTASLLICSQFGVGRGHLVAHAFMSFGETVCLALCGALFLGCTLFVSSFVLSASELRGIRRFGYAPVIILGLLSLTGFFCLGADIVLQLALAWLLGGLAAGIIATETGLQVRSALARSA